VTSHEVSRILLYNIPALLLILHLLLRDFSPREAGFARPDRHDALTAVLALAGLLVAAALLSLTAKNVAAGDALPIPEAPRGALQWLLMLGAAITTAYLEETYFRAYLLTRFGHAGIARAPRILVSVLLFSFCHLYEGTWGILNAVAAGCILALLYERRQSVHGIAWAHAAYNALVYATGF